MPDSLGYSLTLRLFAQGNKFFGPGVAGLLELVEETGSLRMAAARMGMAYSKAWKVVRRSSEALGFALLDSRTGGAGGGGASLTPEGRAFLEKYRRFERAVYACAEELFDEHFRV